MFIDIRIDYYYYCIINYNYFIVAQIINLTELATSLQQKAWPLPMLKNDKNVIATASWHRGLPSACGSTPHARVLIYRWCARRQRGTVLTVTQRAWVHWSSPTLIWLVVFRHPCEKYEFVTVIRQLG